jgi:hypothetical protein
VVKFTYEHVAKDAENVRALARKHDMTARTLVILDRWVTKKSGTLFLKPLWKVCTARITKAPGRRRREKAMELRRKSSSAHAYAFIIYCPIQVECQRQAHPPNCRAFSALGCFRAFRATVSPVACFVIFPQTLSASARS